MALKRQNRALKFVLRRLVFHLGFTRAKILRPLKRQNRRLKIDFAPLASIAWCRHHAKNSRGAHEFVKSAMT